MTQTKKAKSKVDRKISLSDFGIHGYGEVEAIIFAALITGDPLLLIGPCGTGKTQLLNTLSEALGLEHRHYNASLISFDDLVGFPYPDMENKGIEYLRTPATVWDAESVLIDEISRCKPEHQNRLFSVIQERKIQGLPLDRLKYRWAAMNPYSKDGSTSDSYIGAEPLDQALADRFPFIVRVPDWNDFNETTQREILDQHSTEATSDTIDELSKRLSAWRVAFEEAIMSVPDEVYEYCRIVASEFGNADFRISPRRARQLVRNIVAVGVFRNSLLDEKNFLLGLEWSLPQRAWDETPSQQIIHSIHRTAWDTTIETGKKKWLAKFHLEKKLNRKLALVVENAPDLDTGTLAISQLLSLESKERAAAFAFAVYPTAVEGRLPIGAEAISDLGQIAVAVMDVDGRGVRLKQQFRSENDLREKLESVLQELNGPRRERAEQLFNYLWVEKLLPEDPKQLEEELEECVKYISKLG